MARDAVALIRALGFDQVDLLGFSLGGFVAQVIAQEEPQLVRKLVLAGTGPAGGEGIDKVTPITIRAMLKGGLTFKDPKTYLFFTRTANGKAAAARVHEAPEGAQRRTATRRSPRWRSVLSSRRSTPGRGRSRADLSSIRQPVLVANGDHDLMVPSSNSVDLARRLPNARLKLYPDAGHGGVFQYHEEFVAEVLEFLSSE